MRRDLRAEGFLLLTALIWGGTFVAIKGGLEDISPMLMVGIRFLLSGLLAWPILLPRRRQDDESPTPGLFSLRTWRWGFVIGFAMLIGYAGQTIGLQYTTVARSGFITYTFALYVPFLQFVLLKKKPGWGNLSGLLVVLWGLSFITDPTRGPLTIEELSPLRIVRAVEMIIKSGLNWGDLYTLIGAVGYAFYVVLLDRATRVCHPGEVTVIQMFICGALALILVPFVEVPYLNLSWGLAGSLFYLIAFGSILALALMNWFQRRVTPLRAVLIYAIEPVFAASLGWAILGTGMSTREIMGAALILAGILISDIWSIFLSNRRRITIS